MSKIKILHITQATIGGTLEYIKLFFTNIDKNKYEIELICPKYGPMKDEMERNGFKVHVVNMKREINLIEDYKSYVELKRVIKEIKPDIVHIHSSKAGVIGRLAIRNMKIPCVYNAHGWAFSMNISNKKKKFYALIERICARYTYKIINISNYEQNLALKYQIANRDKMDVIYNGIDIGKYQYQFDRKKITNELKIPEDSFIIGMVGRLTQQKSHQIFIKLAEMISKQIDNAYFILVGDGELREYVESLIKEKKLENKFLITGWTNDVPKYISVFDIGILTSKWEGFGLVLTEYMASGKPIVASNVGGIPDVIQNNYNGILVRQNDIDSFVKAILEIKNNHRLRFSLIENGYKVVKEKFNIYRVVREHEDLYEKIVANNLNSKII